MKSKASKLRLCNCALLPVSALMLVSSIQLEIIAAGSELWVWRHILLGLLFGLLVGWHLQLHFRWRNWLRLLWKQKASNTRWLTVTGFLTLLTAIAATIGWILSPDHSMIGAIHGKFGFLFIALAAWHIIRRARFYSR